MASPSPFDDLLKEFDDDVLSAPRHPPEDPLRGENLQKLLALSKKLEAIAKMLDPSDTKHPLNGQTVPEEARARLKALVSELMSVQETLHSIEKNLLEPQATTETATPAAPTNHDPFADLDAPFLPRRGDRARFPEGEEPISHSSSSPRDEIRSKETDPFLASNEKSRSDLSENPPSMELERDRAPIRQSEPMSKPPLEDVHDEERMPLTKISRETTFPQTKTAQTRQTEPPSGPTPPAPPAITPDHLHLEKERHDFETYKAGWEQVFAADPSQRAAHPEVQQYYDQMETYFKEKMAYLSTNTPQP